MVYPFVDDWGKQNRLKIKYEEKKQRIFMRGVKIGTKRTQSTKGMGIFEMSKKAESPAESAQNAEEAKAKAAMSDESLGLK